MGELDPDFPNQRTEADWIAQAVHGEVVMVPEAGHYPQSQRPDITTEAVLRFLTTVNDGASQSTSAVEPMSLTRVEGGL
jgi:pimeloyl-ACP methyl ester carboxylesterase